MPLSSEDRTLLGQRDQATTDAERNRACWQLALRHLGLAGKIVGRHCRQRYAAGLYVQKWENLMREAEDALFHAARKFQVGQPTEVSFQAYAGAVIWNQIKTVESLDYTITMRPNQAAQPRTAETARAVEMARSTVYLDLFHAERWGAGATIPAPPDSSRETAQRERTLQRMVELIDQLPSRSRDLLTRCWGIGGQERSKLRVLGDEYGVSGQSIFNWRRNAETELRALLEREGIDESTAQLSR